MQIFKIRKRQLISETNNEELRLEEYETHRTEGKSNNLPKEIVYVDGVRREGEVY